MILALVEEACAALERRGADARTLDLVFERVDGSVQVVRVGTARPVRDVPHLTRLLGERIETVAPGLDVEAMRLVLPLVEPLTPVQRINDLGEGCSGTVDIAALVDRLSNRLSADKVYRVVPVGATCRSGPCWSCRHWPRSAGQTGPHPGRAPPDCCRGRSRWTR